MRLSFYTKLLFTFIFFAVFVLAFSSYLFAYFYKEHHKTKEIKSIEILFNYQEKKVKNYLLDIENRLNSINEDKLLDEQIDFILKSDRKIKAYSFMNLKGEELRSYRKTGKNILQIKKEELKSISKEDIYRDLISLKIGEVWNSSFDIDDKKNIDFSKPFLYEIKFIKRVKKGFISLTFDARPFFDDLENIFLNKRLYVIDETAHFIIHEKKEYNFSKFFAINKTVHNQFMMDAKSILENNTFQTKEFISKKFYLTSGKYFIILIKFDKQAQALHFEEFKKYIYSILMVGLFIAVILALIFSEPIANQNEKIEKKNRDLDFDNKQNIKELSENTKTINKYVMFVRMNKDGVIVHVSDALCEFTGFAKEELLGHHHKILIHPDVSKKVYNKTWQELQELKPIEKELKGIKKNGIHYLTQSYFEPIVTANVLTGFIEVRTDITDKKIIQNLCSDINYKIQEYNAIFENVDSGIAVIDLKGKFQSINNMFTKLLGYSRVELLEMSCKDVIYKNSKDVLKKILEEVKEIGDISNIEKIFVCKKGEKIHLEMSINILPDRKNFVIVVNSLEDKRKLQELNQNLEKKILQEVEKNRQKDKIHQEEQIRNTKLSSIGALAAGITHEINTPLTYIKGNFEMMTYDLQSFPDSDTKTYMLEDSEKIKDGITRIENIVESMREMSQTSTEAKEDVNIYSTIITALTMAYNRSKQITRVYIQDTLFTIENIEKEKYKFISKVQKQRLEQVWIVIINNALDELTKILDYENRALKIDLVEKKSEIVITFTDNAGGIDEDILDDIFEPFISSKAQGGMGIGLNIAKKIIDEQCGTINAYNDNKQAIFEVRLKKCE